MSAPTASTQMDTSSASFTGLSTRSTSTRRRAHDVLSPERRVQPRHFHDGPNSVTGTHTVGANVAAASSGVNNVTISPTRVVLHRHALESIFSFLNQGELALALRVSNNWLSAVQSMARLELVQKVLPKTVPVYVFGGSVMGRHVTTIGNHLAPVRLIPDWLYILSCMMPHLRELHCSITPPLSQAALIFPSSLRRLCIRVPEYCSPERINATLKSISRLSLLETLAIQPRSIDPQVSFAPLLALQSHLLQLYIFDWKTVDVKLTDTQVDELRALTKLRKMVVLGVSNDTMRRLIHQPHDLQWQDIRLKRLMDDDAAELLPQLPSLTKLDVPTSCTRFGWLLRLRNLKHVGLMSVKAVQVVAEESDRVKSLVDALSHCNQIESLVLGTWTRLTTAHLVVLLPHLLNLQELTLSHLDVESLTFLSHPTIAGRLHALKLVKCKRLSVTELHHVHALRALRTLILQRCFTTSLDAYCQSLYTPPSIILPQLEHFSYTL